MATSSESPHGFNVIVAGSSLLLLVVILLYDWIDPEGLTWHLQHDGVSGRTGVVEHLTVLVLIPGILSGLYAFWAYRDRLPLPILGYWVLAWSLACIYFAGEEISWGQWFFRWETPELIGQLNDQGETNLHNMSHWLDQKPRALVELFIAVAGFLIPLWRVIGNRKPIIRRGFLSKCEGWIYAPTAFLTAGILFLVIRIADWIDRPAFENIGDSELREFSIAWFLGWYLISYAVRLKRIPADVSS